MEEGSKSLHLFGSLVPQQEEETEEGRQLTFFYGGKVYVFLNISPPQVAAILSAAEQLKEESPPPLLDISVHHQREEEKPNFPISVVQQQHHLPLVNKDSLARFFANRRRSKLQRVKEMEMKDGDSSTFVKNGYDDDANHLLPAFKKQRHTSTHALPLFPC